MICCRGLAPNKLGAKPLQLTPTTKAMAKFLDKTIKTGVFLAFLMPLAFTSRTMYPWHFGKTILFQILVEILMILVAFDFGLNKRKLVKWHWLDLLIILFVAAQLLASVFGVDFSKSFWGDQQRAHGVFTWLHFLIFYFLLRQYLAAKKDWLALTIWALSVAAVSCLFAWVGRYTDFLGEAIPANIQLCGLLGNPIFFASYLTIPLFAGLALFFSSSNRWRWLALLAFAGVFITMIFTQVRGAFLGMLAGLAVITLVYLFSGKNKKAKVGILISLFLAISLLSAAYVVNQKSDFLLNNAPVLHRLLNISSQEATASTRLLAWQVTLKGWRDKPILGWGWENFKDLFSRHYDQRFLKYSFAETTWDKPHNFPLEVLSETGVVGFGAYLAIVILAFYYLASTIKKRAGERRALFFIILAGGLTAHIVQSAFAFETSDSLLVWFTLLAFISFSRDGVVEEIKKNQQKLCSNIFVWLLLILALLSPYLVYKNYTLFHSSVLMGDARDAAEINSKYQWQKKAIEALNYPAPFSREHAVFVTEDLVGLDGVDNLDAKTLEAVAPRLKEIFKQSLKKKPDSYLLNVWAGKFYSLLGAYVDFKHFKESNALFEKAIKISPYDQKAPILLARNYLMQGETEKGLELLKKLTGANPDYSETHWFLGLALINDGRKAEGLTELERGFAFGSAFEGNISFLISLYAEAKDYAKIVPLYKKLIEIKPANAVYYAGLVATYAELGDKENVLFYLNKAVELDPSLEVEAKLFLEQKNIK